MLSAGGAGFGGGGAAAGIGADTGLCSTGFGGAGAAAAGAGAAAAEGASPVTFSLNNLSPAFTVVPEGTYSSSMIPWWGAGIGMAVLSVSISATTSSSRTASPLFFNHL